jgi:hypothetical protein
MGVKIDDDLEDMLKVELAGKKALGPIENKGILIPLTILDKLFQEIAYWRKEANREWTDGGGT